MLGLARRGALQGAKRTVRRTSLPGAGQVRSIHFRSQGPSTARSFSADASVQRDVASAASYFFDAKAACKNKRCALGQDHSGIVANPTACGEDSYFLSSRIVGVADGVGGWNENGVDPGEISRCLMRNAGQFVKQQAELKKDVSTLQVLAHGYEQALRDDSVEAGSTTACIIKVKEAADGKPVLEYTNLGDSGFVIIRDGKVIFRSKFQVRGAWESVCGDAMMLQSAEWRARFACLCECSTTAALLTSSPRSRLVSRSMEPLRITQTT